MTAVNIFRSRDAVHVVTDGKGVGLRAGNIVGVSKVLVFPHLNLAAAVRGHNLLFGFLGQVLPLAGNSFDEVRNNFTRVIMPLLEKSTEEWIAGGLPKSAADQGGEFYVAGIKGDGSPTGYAVVTHSIYTDAPPGVVTDIPNTVFAPGTPQLLERASALTEPHEPTAVPKLAIDILEQQMRIDGWTADGARTHCGDGIGLFAQMTTVGVEGIFTRIIHRWQ